MKLGKYTINIREGDAEGVTFSGNFEARRTMLFQVGRHSISKRALQLGVVLILCQLLDGFLTWLGIGIYGVKMEGNAFLHALMKAYGAAPAILVIKLLAIVLVVFLTWYAHGRRWIRPLIVALCLVYLLFAIWPWTYIVSNYLAGIR